MDYTTIRTNYDLRLATRGQLKGVWRKMALAEFLVCLIFFPIYLLSYLSVPDMTDPYAGITMSSILAEIVIVPLSCLLAGPVAVGLAGFYLRRIRGEEIYIGNVFDGFKRFWDSFLLVLLQSVFVILWSMLLIVPGLIKSYSYFMVFYIMRDNPGMRPIDAITKSRQMMDGSKWRLFMLHLSFIGWGLLCLLPALIGGLIITFFIVGATAGGGLAGGLAVLLFASLLIVVSFVCFLFLTPYVSLATANFYENMKTRFEKQVAESASSENSGGEKLATDTAGENQ